MISSYLIVVRRGGRKRAAGGSDGDPGGMRPTIIGRAASAEGFGERIRESRLSVRFVFANLFSGRERLSFSGGAGERYFLCRRCRREEKIFRGKIRKIPVRKAKEGFFVNFCKSVLYACALLKNVV